MPVFRNGKKLPYYPRRTHLKRHRSLSIGYANVPTVQGVCPCFIIDDVDHVIAMDTRGTAYDVLVEEVRKRHGFVKSDPAKLKRDDLLKKHEDVAKAAAYRRLTNKINAMKTLNQETLANDLMVDIDKLMK